MTRCAKSGWPVTGHSEVNSGAVNRARYSVLGCGFGAVSKIASSGEAGAALWCPSWLRVGLAFMRGLADLR